MSAGCAIDKQVLLSTAIHGNCLIYGLNQRKHGCEEMTQITLKLPREDAVILEKMLATEKIDSKRIEKPGGFLPYGWIEIVISLTAALIPILYDLVKRKKNDPKIRIEMNGTSFELNADNIGKLELKWASERKKKRKGPRG